MIFHSILISGFDNNFSNWSFCTRNLFPTLIVWTWRVTIFLIFFSESIGKYNLWTSLIPINVGLVTATAVRTVVVADDVWLELTWTGLAITFFAFFTSIKNLSIYKVEILEKVEVEKVVTKGQYILVYVLKYKNDFLVRFLIKKLVVPKGVPYGLKRKVIEKKVKKCLK